jgi:integrase
VSVLRSYDSDERIMGGTRKNRKARLVTVPPMVCHGLEMLAAMNPHGGDDLLVFWSDRTPNKPCDCKMIERGLYRALADIGIDEAEHRRCSLSFHSWRHWLNSRLIEAHVAHKKNPVFDPIDLDHDDPLTPEDGEDFVNVAYRSCVNGSYFLAKKVEEGAGDPKPKPGNSTSELEVSK